MHFNRFFSAKAYFKACIEVPKIQLPFFPCQPLLCTYLMTSTVYPNPQLVAM